MQDWIGLLPAFPLAGFLLLVLSRGRMPRKLAALIGAGSVGLSFLLAAAICIEFLSGDGQSFQKTLWVACSRVSPSISMASVW
jgi:NADH-quinone oxidoreductase subunit L